jgi:hypothetical protein
MKTPDPAADSPDVPPPEKRAAKTVGFRATIPVKAAAIDIHGETGARLTLEIADSDLPDFLPIVLLRGKRLNVSITEAE